MVSEKVKIVNEMGFHMRPANVFVTAMSKYSSDINIITDGSCINGKSIMNIMASGIKYGSEITIECNGNDEQKMLDEAVEIIKNGFGEM